MSLEVDSSLTQDLLNAWSHKTFCSDENHVTGNTEWAPVMTYIFNISHISFVTVPFS